VGWYHHISLSVNVKQFSLGSPLMAHPRWLSVTNFTDSLSTHAYYQAFQEQLPLFV